LSNYREMEKEKQFHERSFAKQSSRDRPPSSTYRGLDVGPSRDDAVRANIQRTGPETSQSLELVGGGQWETANGRVQVIKPGN